MMYAEYIVHGLCDILLTGHILEDKLSTPSMDPRELEIFRRVAYHLQWLIVAKE